MLNLYANWLVRLASSDKWKAPTMFILSAMQEMDISAIDSKLPIVKISQRTIPYDHLKKRNQAFL